MNKGFLARKSFKGSGLFSAPQYDLNEYLEYGLPSTPTAALCFYYLRNKYFPVLRRRLEPVPVFVLAVGDEPVLFTNTHPRLIQNKRSPSFAFFFILPADAEEWLRKIKSKNPDLAKNVTLLCIHLDEACELVEHSKEQASVWNFAFRFFPNPAQVDKAAFLCESHQMIEDGQRLRRTLGEGMFLEGGGIVPLFTSSMIRMNSPEGEMVTPLFFTMSDLEMAVEDIRKTGAKEFQKALARDVAEIGRLQQVLDEMNRRGLLLDADEQFGSVAFYAARESQDWVQRLEERQALISEQNPTDLQLQVPANASIFVDGPTQDKISEVETVRERMANLEKKVATYGPTDCLTVLRADVPKYQAKLDSFASELTAMLATDRTRKSNALSYLKNERPCRRDLDKRICDASRELDMMKLGIIRQIFNQFEGTESEPPSRSTQRLAVRVVSDAVVDTKGQVDPDFIAENVVPFFDSFVKELPSTADKAAVVDPEFQRYACQGLMRLAVSNDAGRLMLQEKTIQHLVSALKAASMPAAALADAARAIARLVCLTEVSVVEETRKLLVRDDAVGRLVPYLSPKAPDATADILRAFVVLAEHERCREALVKDKCVEALVGLLSSSKSPDLLLPAVNALRVFSSQPALRKAVVACLPHGAFAADALSSHAATRSALLELTKLFTEKEQEGLAPALVQRNLVPCIILIISKSSDVATLRDALLCLHRLVRSGGDEALTAVLYNWGVTYLAEVPKKAADDTVLREFTSIVQYLVLREKDGRTKVFYEGCFEEAVKCVRHADQSIKLAAALSLSMLALYDPNKVAKAGVLDAIAAVAGSFAVSSGRDFRWPTFKPLVDMLRSSLFPLKYLAAAYTADRATEPRWHLRMAKDGVVAALLDLLEDTSPSQAPTQAAPAGPSGRPNNSSAPPLNGSVASAGPNLFLRIHVQNALVCLAGGGFGLEEVRAQVADRLGEHRALQSKAADLQADRDRLEKELSLFKSRLTRKDKEHAEEAARLRAEIAEKDKDAKLHRKKFEVIAESRRKAEEAARAAETRNIHLLNELEEARTKLAWYQAAQERGEVPPMEVKEPAPDAHQAVPEAVGENHIEAADEAARKLQDASAGAALEVKSESEPEAKADSEPVVKTEPEPEPETEPEAESTEEAPVEASREGSGREVGGAVQSEHVEEGARGDGLERADGSVVEVGGEMASGVEVRAVGAAVAVEAGVATTPAEIEAAAAITEAELEEPEPQPAAPAPVPSPETAAPAPVPLPEPATPAPVPSPEPATPAPVHDAHRTTAEAERSPSSSEQPSHPEQSAEVATQPHQSESASQPPADVDLDLSNPEPPTETAAETPATPHQYEPAPHPAQIPDPVSVETEARTVTTETVVAAEAKGSASGTGQPSHNEPVPDSPREGELSAERSREDAPSSPGRIPTVVDESGAVVTEESEQEMR